MIAHDRVSVDRNREALTYQKDSCLDPVLPVLERLPGVAVDAAEKRPPHAALDAMKSAFCARSYKLRAGASHASSIPRLAHTECQAKPQTRLGKV